MLTSIELLEIVNDSKVEDEYIKTDVKLMLYEALQKLDSDTREVIYLKMTGELTFKQIGKILR